jgi:flagellar biosynthesis/type III secretory pathway M-ring protein FliF/YscJ
VDNQPLLPPQPSATELPTSSTSPSAAIGGSVPSATSPAINPTDNTIVLTPETKSANKNWLWLLLLFVLLILIAVPIIVVKLLQPAGLTNQPVLQPSPLPTTAKSISSPTPTLASTKIEDIENDLQTLPTLSPVDTSDLNTDLQGL